jgi:hypothetical protein
VAREGGEPGSRVPLPSKQAATCYSGLSSVLMHSFNSFKCDLFNPNTSSYGRQFLRFAPDTSGTKCERPSETVDALKSNGNYIYQSL